MSTAVPRLYCPPAGHQLAGDASPRRRRPGCCRAPSRAGGRRRAACRAPAAASEPGEVGRRHEVDALRRRDRDGRAAGDAAGPVGRVRRHDAAGRDVVAEHRLGDGDRRAGSPAARRSPARRSCRRASGRSAAPGRSRRRAGPCVPGSTSPPASSVGVVGHRPRDRPTRRRRSRRSARRAGRATSSCSGELGLGLGLGQPGEVREDTELGAVADDDEERLVLGELCAGRRRGADDLARRRVVVAALVAHLDVPVEVGRRRRAPCCSVGPDQLGDGVLGHLEQLVGEQAEAGEGDDHDEGDAPTAPSVGACGRRRATRGADQPGRPPVAGTTAVGGAAGAAAAGAATTGGRGCGRRAGRRVAVGVGRQRARAASSSRIRSSSPSYSAVGPSGRRRRPAPGRRRSARRPARRRGGAPRRRPRPSAAGSAGGASASARATSRSARSARRPRPRRDRPRRPRRRRSMRRRRAPPAVGRRPSARRASSGSGAGRRRRPAARAPARARRAVRAPPVGSLGRRSWLGSSSNAAGDEDRDRRRPGQLLGRPHQAAPELGGRRAVGRVGAPGPLEHRRPADRGRPTPASGGRPAPTAWPPSSGPRTAPRR